MVPAGVRQHGQDAKSVAAVDHCGMCRAGMARCGFNRSRCRGPRGAVVSGAVNVRALEMRAKFCRDALTDARSRGAAGPELAAAMVAESRARVAYALAVLELLTTRACRAYARSGVPVEGSL